MSAYESIRSEFFGCIKLDVKKSLQITYSTLKYDRF